MVKKLWVALSVLHNYIIIAKNETRNEEVDVESEGND